MSLRDLERVSIREFVEAHADKLTGRVLDLGCGLQPYRDVVEAAGGEYHGWDRVANPGSVVTEDVGNFDWAWGDWSAILCTQIIQYAWWEGADIYGTRDDGFLWRIRRAMLDGWLVMTGPTNWPVVEVADRVRFTATEIGDRLKEVGFTEVEVTERAHVEFEGERWATGWGAVARA